VGPPPKSTGPLQLPATATASPAAVLATAWSEGVPAAPRDQRIFPAASKRETTVPSIGPPPRSPLIRPVQVTSPAALAATRGSAPRPPKAWIAGGVSATSQPTAAQVPP